MHTNEKYYLVREWVLTWEEECEHLCHKLIKKNLDDGIEGKSCWSDFNLEMSERCNIKARIPHSTDETWYPGVGFIALKPEYLYTGKELLSTWMVGAVFVSVDPGDQRQARPEGS